MDKISKEVAELLCNKVDVDGLSYAIMEGYLDAPGTPLEPLVESAKKILNEIEEKLNFLREKYEIEES